MHTVKKLSIYLLITQEREEISKNSKGFGFSRPKAFIICKKIFIKIMKHCYK
jgi:hypothetical protein